MGLHAAIPLVAAVANLVIGAAVLSHGYKDRLGRVFAFLSLCMTSWNLGIFALYYFPDIPSAEIWSRVFRTGIVFAPTAAFHTALVLNQSRTRTWSFALFASYLFSTFLAVLNAKGLLVSGLTAHYWGWYIERTQLYDAVTMHVVMFTALSVERTFHAYRFPHSTRGKAQAKFWFLAFALATGFMLTNVAVIYGAAIYPLGNFGNVIYASIIAYAIVRHRLMDVDYIVRKFVSFSAALAIIMIPGGVGLHQLSVIVGAEEPMIIVLASVALALTAIIMVPTLQSALETRVQQAFFPRKYDYRQRLRRFSAQLVHVLDEKSLVRQLGDTLSDVLDVEYCRIYLDTEHGGALVREYPSGDESPTLSAKVTSVCKGLTEPVLVSELERRHRSAYEELRADGVEVILPLRIEDRVTGVVLLARNRDFLLISTEDLQLLASVAASASVALENSRLSTELRRSEAVLARANRLSSIGTLAAGIAHEIRNPLTAVKTFLDLLPERKDDDEFVAQFRDLSLAELKRVTDLINDLLAIGRSTSANRREVSLGDAVEPVTRLLEASARKRRVTLSCTTEPGLPPIHADPDQLKQVTINLLLNAIDASPPDSTVSVRVWNGAAGPTFEIRDQGVGIPPDQLDNIFEPFFTTKDSGTGLGLSLVHQMVVEHGGEIEVDSELGRGTVFQVTFPPAETVRATGT